MTSEISGAAGPGAAGYRERLTPAVWIWLSAIIVAGFMALVAVPFGTPTAVVSAIVTLVLLVVVLVVWSPVVTVADGELVAGRAHVPVNLLGEVTALDPGSMRHALGPGFDARAHLCIRGWIPTGVRVDLDDPDDPTPYWLLSSRRPEALVAAVREAQSLADSA